MGATPVPGRIFEVITFEVKPTDAIEVSSVYEALAHRRASTRAYVVLHIPEEKVKELQPAIDAVCDEAKKFGIGVISVGEPTDFDTWETLLDADRVEPDPARLNEFIAKQTATEIKEQVVKWFK